MEGSIEKHGIHCQQTETALCSESTASPMKATVAAQRVTSAILSLLNAAFAHPFIVSRSTWIISYILRPLASVAILIPRFSWIP